MLLMVLFAEAAEIAAKASADANTATGVSTIAAMSGISGLAISIFTMYNNRKRDRDKQEADLRREKDRLDGEIEMARLKLEHDSVNAEMRLEIKACEEHRALSHKLQESQEKKHAAELAEIRIYASEANKRAEEAMQIILKRQKEFKEWQDAHPSAEIKLQKGELP